jgi:hypothetical protein
MAKTTRASAALVGLAMLAIAVTIAFETSAQETLNPRMKLLARRAAKIDALRNLLETVYGLRIDADTTVRDFVTAEDLVRSKLSAGIRGAREIDYVEHADGSAEVTVEIELGALETILGAKIQYDHEIIEATGYGVPPGMAAGSSPRASGLLVRAVGYGLEPQEPGLDAAEKDLLGFRAAKVDAMRNLAEEIYRVQINAESTVRDFAVQNDGIRTRINTMINGATVLSEEKLADGRYKVEIETGIEPLENMIAEP